MIRRFRAVSFVMSVASSNVAFADPGTRNHAVEARLRSIEKKSVSPPYHRTAQPARRAGGILKKPTAPGRLTNTAFKLTR